MGTGSVYGTLELTHNLTMTDGECLSGWPDDLYDMPSYYGITSYSITIILLVDIESLNNIKKTTGTTYYLKPIDGTIVAISKTDAHLSRSIDDDFYMACMSIALDNLSPFDLYRDINVDNSLDVHTLLVESFLS